MSEENVETLTAAYAAYNRRPSVEELRKLVHDFCDPAVEWRPIQETRTYVGHEGVVEAITGWFETWEDIRIEAEEFFDEGESVIATVRVCGRGRGSGIETEGRTFHVFTMREGRVLEFREYADRDEALEAAGLSE